MEGLMNFTYNSDINKIIDITIENNEDMIKSIKDIIVYNKGIWNNNKRIDYYTIKYYEESIPEDLKKIINMLISKNKTIETKVKIKIIEKNQNQLKLKIKINLINYFTNIIFKLIKFKINVFISFNPSNFMTSVEIFYTIKSKLFSSYNNSIFYIIENIIKPNYVFKIDEYIKNSLLKK